MSRASSGVADCALSGTSAPIKSSTHFNSVISTGLQDHQGHKHHEDTTHVSAQADTYYMRRAKRVAERRRRTLNDTKRTTSVPVAWT